MTKITIADDEINEAIEKRKNGGVFESKMFAKNTLEDEVRLFRTLPLLYELVEAHYKHSEEKFENELNRILNVYKNSVDRIEINECKNLGELKGNTNALINEIRALKKHIEDYIKTKKDGNFDFHVNRIFNINPKEILKKYCQDINLCNDDELLKICVYKGFHNWLVEQDDILYYPLEKDQKSCQKIINKMFELAKEEK